MAADQPRVRVRTATPADAERMADIFHSAFGGDTMNSLMHGPEGASPSARARFRASIFPAPTDDGDKPGPGPDGRHPRKGEALETVAELEGTGEVVAVGRWTLHAAPRDEWEWDGPHKDLTAEQLGEGVNVEVHNAFLGGMKQMEKKHVQGAACLILNILATDKTKGRLGAGTALVRWGTELADEKGLPVFLESSPVGYRVYKRLGFRDIGTQDLEITKRWGVIQGEGENWGGENGVDVLGPLAPGHYRTVMMCRPAKKDGPE